MTPDLLLNVHNLGRWAVLLTAAWALARAWRGYAGSRPWGRADQLSGLTFTTVLNLQFVVGVALYFNSPLVRPLFADRGYLAGGFAVVFFAAVHPLAMVTAAVLAQVVYSVAKRAADDRRRFRAAAVGYTAAAVLVLAAVPWPFLGYGRPLVPGSARGGQTAGPAGGESRGAALFRSHCASCHGPAGRGDGRSAAGLRPPPRDFASAEWRFERTRESARRVIADGIPGTAMPSHRTALSGEEIDVLAGYVLDLAGGPPLPAMPESEEGRLLREAGFVDLRGTDAPPLVLVDAGGKEVRLRDLRGKPVLLYFWATNSADARRELPVLARLAGEGAWQVVPVARDSEDPEAVKRILSAVAPGLRAFVEGQGVGLAKFELSPSPAAWLLDSAGRPIGRANGPRDWSGHKTRAVLGHWADRP